MVIHSFADTFELALAMQSRKLLSDCAKRQCSEVLETPESLATRFHLTANLPGDVSNGFHGASGHVASIGQVAHVVKFCGMKTRLPGDGPGDRHPSISRLVIEASAANFWLFSSRTEGDPKGLHGFVNGLAIPPIPGDDVAPRVSSIRKEASNRSGGPARPMQRLPRCIGRNGLRPSDATRGGIIRRVRSERASNTCQPPCGEAGHRNAGLSSSSRAGSETETINLRSASGPKRLVTTSDFKRKLGKCPSGLCVGRAALGAVVGPPVR